MVRTKTLTAKPKRPRPMSRSAAKTVADKYYGSEPIDVSLKGMTEALNWYNYMFEVDTAREWLLEYMKKHYSKQDIAAVKALPNYEIPTTVGWIARIIMNGNEINSPYFTNRLGELIERGIQLKAPKKTETHKPVVSIQERMLVKHQQLFADCEVEVIDCYGSMYDFLISKQITPAAATYFKSKYTPVYDELMSDDPEVKEAYGKRLKSERQYWQGVLADLDRYIGNKKVTKIRKPREKKTKSAVEQVKSLNYQKEFPPLKIVSVNPAEIIGSQQLWAYNTKTRKLTNFDSVGPSGLQVKGASIIGFDVEKSYTKRLRKPELVIQQLLSAGKVTLRKFMDTINTTKDVAKGRINSDTVLLRVIK